VFEEVQSLEEPIRTAPRGSAAMLRSAMANGGWALSGGSAHLSNSDLVVQ